MPNLQTYYHVKLYFQNMDQHTVGKYCLSTAPNAKYNQL